MISEFYVFRTVATQPVTTSRRAPQVDSHMAATSVRRPDEDSSKASSFKGYFPIQTAQKFKRNVPRRLICVNENRPGVLISDIRGKSPVPFTLRGLSQAHFGGSQTDWIDSVPTRLPGRFSLMQNQAPVHFSFNFRAVCIAL